MNQKRKSSAPRSAGGGPPHSRRLGCLTVVLLILVSLSLAVFLGRSREPIAPLIQRGREALERKDFLTAADFAERALRRKPDSNEAHFLAGRVARSLGDHARALEHFARIPDDKSVIAILARCDAGDILLLERFRLSDSEVEFRRALRQDPGSLRAQDHLAYALGLGARNWELIPHRLAMIELDRIEPLHLYLLSLGDTALENDHLISQYARVADDPAPLLARSRLAFEEQNYERAAALARQAIQLSPQLIEAHVKLGRVLLQTGADDAFEAWHANLPPGADEHPGIWALRAAWSERRSSEQVAARCYWETLRRDANHQQANYRLGQLLIHLGRTADAQPFLDRAQGLQEYVNAVKVTVESGDLNRARVAARLAEQLGLAWEAYAWHQLTIQLNPQARESLEKCQQLRNFFAAGERPRARNIPAANLTSRINLAEFPQFTTSGLASSTARQAGPGAVTSRPSFEDQASAVGVNFRYLNGGNPVAGIKKMYEFTGGGTGILDFDNDGWPDVYLTQGCPWPPAADQTVHLDRLFRNLGTGRFEDVTQSAGILENGFGQGVAIGDYDADGFSDVYVANIGGNRFFRNLGDGTFTDITTRTATAGDQWTSSCVLADFNGDSLPDLYVVNYLSGDNLFDVTCGGDRNPAICMPQSFPGAQDRLYINRGDGGFDDVTSTSGIEVPHGKGLGVVAADFDQDGRLEIFVANDSVPNFFFRNENPAGQPVHFAELGLLSGLALDDEGKAEACMGVAAGDPNLDGRLDLYVTNFYQESNTYYQQDEDGRFTDGTQRAGLRDPSIFVLGFGTQFIDAELDGLPDLMVANGHISDLRSRGSPYQMSPQYYRNVGLAGQFQEVAGSQLGKYFEGHYLGRSMARWDWNRDGREDIVIGHLDAPLALLTNTTAPAGKFLAVQLRGTMSARDAIGATVRITVGGRTLVQQLVAGDGYQASNERRLVFGLGDTELVTSLTVRWPSGLEQSYTDLAANSELVLVEGRAAAVRWRDP